MGRCWIAGNQRSLRGKPSCLLMRVCCVRKSAKRNTLANDRSNRYIRDVCSAVDLEVTARGKYLVLDLRSNIHLTDTLSFIDNVNVSILDNNL